MSGGALITIALVAAGYAVWCIFAAIFIARVLAHAERVHDQVHAEWLAGETGARTAGSPGGREEPKAARAGHVKRHDKSVDSL